MSVTDEQFIIRSIVDPVECEALEKFQVEVGCFSEEEAYPSKIMRVAIASGGTIHGLFDNNNRIRGCAFQLTGRLRKQQVAWTYMVLLEPGLENVGYEQRLMQAQIDARRKNGFPLLCWIFDPFDTETAFLSLNELGAVCREYRLDFPVKTLFPTRGLVCPDRLIAEFDLEGEYDPGESMQPSIEMAGEPAKAGEMILAITEVAEGSLPPEPRLDLTGDRLLLPVPKNMRTLIRDNPGAADSWRAAVRTAFQHYFAKKYYAADFISTFSNASEFGFYLLKRSV
jgi:predicted GNAT superfamily acetyltransferase